MSRDGLSVKIDPVLCRALNSVLHPVRRPSLSNKILHESFGSKSLISEKKDIQIIFSVQYAFFQEEHSVIQISNMIQSRGSVFFAKALQKLLEIRLLVCKIII